MSHAAIGAEIKALREEKGLSQNQLARKAGISQSGLSAIENTTKNPSIQTIRLLSKALDVSPEYFFCDNNEAIKSSASEEKPLDEQLEGIDFALSGEIRDLTDAEKQDILDYIRFKKMKNGGQTK